MEKTWEEFWGSGKVTDYLAYKAASADMSTLAERSEKDEKETHDGTVSDSNGNGAFRHACW